MIRRIALLLVSTPLCLALSSAQAAPVVVEVQPARDFGYTLGDLVRQHAVVRTDGALDYAHLPDPGPVTPWLELRDIQVDKRREDGRSRYDIYLTYQLFQSADKSETLALPPLAIPLRGAAARALIPAWTFGYAPLIPPGTPDSAVEIRPPREAVPLPTAEHARRLALFAGGALLLMVYLAWVYDLVPGLKRNPGPFTRASRKIKALLDQPETDNLCQAFRVFHQAFNETAGETLFARDFDRFLDSFPRYSTLAEPTRRFFAQSQHLFFDAGAPLEGGFSLDELDRLCRAYQRLESSLP